MSKISADVIIATGSKRRCSILRPPKIAASISSTPHLAQLIGALFLAGLLLLGLASSAMAQDDEKFPSFDCTKAQSKAELLICAVYPLEAQDVALDTVYRDALTISRDHAAALKQEQLTWLKQRDHACGLDGVDAAQVSDGHDQKLVGCMAKVYDDRIRTLVGQHIDPVWKSAARDPRGALTRLRPLQSPLAVAYADLLMHALSHESIADLSAFAEDFDLRYQRQKDGFPLFGAIIIPCELIEHHPRLLLVLRPYFWSSLDLALPNASCGGEYHAYPAAVADFLVHHDRTLRRWQERCGLDGTITHGYARDGWVHELRVARFPRSYLTDAVTWLNRPDQPWPSPEMLASSDWNSDPQYQQARDALADYYRQKFGLAPAAAKTAATRALWDNRDMSKDPNSCD